MTEYLTVQEIQERFGIGEAVAYGLVKSKGFPSIKIGKRILINKKALEEWERNHLGRWVRLP